MKAVNLSNPHRTALGIACSEGELITPGGGGATQQTDLGLAAPTEYNAKYTTTISAEGNDTTSGTVVLELKQIGNAVNAGQTITYTGTCTPGGMTWSVTGSVATKFLPKI